MDIKALRAPDWKDYELIDCGNFEKLERFGPYTLIRPEPQALWDRKLPETKWREMAHARYVAKTSTSGEWERYKPINSPWKINYHSNGLDLSFLLKFTAFKHVGVFPEQAANWNYLFDFIKSGNQDKALNLFAYSGGASLAAKAGGADIIHLDSVKQVVTWARENMDLSGLKDIRWVVEDAAKFAEREAKRGKKYNAIIMDPPSYGLGPSGERWKLEEQLNTLLKNAFSLLDPERHCFILNTYTLNLSALVLKNLIRSIYPQAENIEAGELYVQSKTGFELPLGSYIRFQKR
jgi:23S rRNA (cytosine1962-C5)-methyltransferase